MTKKQKYYVVWEGNKPGVYTSWPEVLKQISGYTRPVFKAFVRREVAEKAFKDDPQKYLSDHYSEPILFSRETVTKKGMSSQPEQGRPVVPSLSVDAACSGNPGVLEYRGVDTETRRQLFRQGPFPLGTVNIGEFLALVHGLAQLKKEGKNIPVYSDSVTAIAWVRNKHPKTELPRNKETEALFKLVDRAVIWLKTNDWDNPVLKWNTKEWGEIPADFGRK